MKKDNRSHEDDAVTAPDSRYMRSLPGGGYVAIESTRESASALVHASLLVERRADPVRRVGHPPPVVAEVVDPDPQRALGALYDIAQDNVEVARALRRWDLRARS
jgi:hypothetical protein